MSSDLQHVRAYHQATKHHPDAYAPGPAFLDWESQPNPFRRYSGAPTVVLPLVAGPDQPRRDLGYDALFEPTRRPAALLSPRSLGLFLELSLGLSAWKGFDNVRWALRNNPSSGNLHPTEGYLLLWRNLSAELGPGLYHYTPHAHALERRARFSAASAGQLAAAHPDSLGALGLSSIPWREEWKYGERAFRYCQHDVGHALAAARFAASVLGWELCTDVAAADDAVAACLGLERSADFSDAEAEHPDLLALLREAGAPGSATPDWAAVAAALIGWTGRANRLSAEHVRWPQLARVLPAVHKADGMPGASRVVPAISLPAQASASTTGPDQSIQMDACALIRQRRSAQRFDGVTGMGLASFERALARTLPLAGRAPFDALPLSPALHLVLFVHAVDDLAPGLYALVRAPERIDVLREACAAQAFDWSAVGIADLPLYRLRAPLDLRRTASRICCHQGIAGRGAFSVAMIADIGRILAAEGAWAYRRLHWEAGIIGQVLYLEAEAAGLRGTGIGCFFDDQVHRLLGLGIEPDAPWQSLYHFTVGAPVEDQRLSTEPPYAHLATHEVDDA